MGQSRNMLRIHCFVSISGEDVTGNEAIEPDKIDIRQEPLSLPDKFFWDTLDIDNPDVVRNASVMTPFYIMYSLFVS